MKCLNKTTFFWKDLLSQKGILLTLEDDSVTFPVTFACRYGVHTAGELELTGTPAWIRQGWRLKLGAAGTAFHSNLHTNRPGVYIDNARGPVYSTSSISITFRTRMETLETF